MTSSSFLPRSEKGQILVLFALVLTALLGLTALAVDGAMVYSDRRAAQNAADSAALAGAGAAAQYLENHNINLENFTCGNSNVIAAINQAKSKAVDAAATNTYTIDTDVSDSNGVTVDCTVTNAGGNKEKYLDVKTVVTSTTNTSFAHLFYSGELKNTVEAVVRVRPRSIFAYGQAIVALSNSCGQNSGGIFFEPAKKQTIQVQGGGGIFSNSCITLNGQGSVDVDGPIRFRTGTIPANDLPNYLDEKPAATTDKLEYDILPEPDCSSVDLHPNGISVIGASGTYDPGRYDSIKITGGKVKLKAGLYCITGSQGISMSSSGSELESLGGVTILVQTGDVQITGGKLDIVAPTSVSQPRDGMVGMLIYMKENNTNPVKITGNGTFDYRGTVYSPSGSIEAGGTSAEESLRARLIAQLIRLHGDVNFTISYDPADNMTLDPSLDLYK